MDTATTLEKGHGCRERRTLSVTTALNEYLDWPGVGPVGRIESIVERDGTWTAEMRSFRTRVPRAVAGAAALVTGPWVDCEQAHSVRDASLGENASRIREESGPEVRAAWRNLAIGFRRSTGMSNIAEAMRRNAARVGELFTKLGIFEL